MKNAFVILLSVLSFCGHAQIADSSLRQVRLSGAVNFRDLGSYQTTDGHQVRRGRIYRSADISKLTDSDLVVLKDLQIHSVVDLRGVEESKKAPDRLNPGTDYILCPAGSDQSLSDWMKTISTIHTAEGGDSMMRAYYSSTEFLAARYRPFFDKLLGLPDGKALLFHCTAGKDRTGIGAALLLYALGVPYETILNDYTATNYYRRAENERMVRGMVQGMHINEPVANELMAARQEYLETTFDAIRKQYGSVDRFLKEQIGLDDEKIAIMKKKYID